MKKFVLIKILILCSPFFLPASDSFFLSGSVSYPLPSDRDFRDIYGSGGISPEIKTGVIIFKHVSAWGGYGFLSKKGTVPVFEAEAKSTQHFFSFGIGYNGTISPKFGYQAGLGMMIVSYKEEALGEQISDSTFGYRIDAAMNYRINKNIYMAFSVAFLSASDKVGDVAIRLGGFKAGLGLGIILKKKS